MKIIVCVAVLSVTVSNLINQIWLIRNSVAKKSKNKLNGKAVSRDPRYKTRKNQQRVV